jgi:molybdopterin biosynthesis enzyme
VVNPETGEILVEEATELDEAAIRLLERAGVTKAKVYTSIRPSHSG